MSSLGNNTVETATDYKYECTGQFKGTQFN
jgi:hypothetical protein